MKDIKLKVLARVTKETAASKYQEYVMKKLKEYKVTSPAEIPREKRRVFWEDVDDGWDAKEDGGEGKKTEKQEKEEKEDKAKEAVKKEKASVFKELAGSNGNMMLKKIRKETFEAVKAMTAKKRGKLLDALHHWFDESSNKPINLNDPLAIISELWSFDPLLGEGGVVDFLVDQRVVKHIATSGCMRYNKGEHVLVNKGKSWSNPDFHGGVVTKVGDKTYVDYGDDMPNEGFNPTESGVGIIGRMKKSHRGPVKMEQVHEMLDESSTGYYGKPFGTENPFFPSNRVIDETYTPILSELDQNTQTGDDEGESKENDQSTQSDVDQNTQAGVGKKCKYSKEVSALVEAGFVENGFNIKRAEKNVAYLREHVANLTPDTMDKVSAAFKLLDDTCYDLR